MHRPMMHSSIDSCHGVSPTASGATTPGLVARRSISSQLGYLAPVDVEHSALTQHRPDLKSTTSIGSGGSPSLTEPRAMQAGRHAKKTGSAGLSALREQGVARGRVQGCGCAGWSKGRFRYCWRGSKPVAGTDHRLRSSPCASTLSAAPAVVTAVPRRDLERIFSRSALSCCLGNQLGGDRPRDRRPRD
jgi:hypothetical protein